MTGAPYLDPDEVEVIAPNFKRRLSGVTSTIIQLVPMQRSLGLGIAVLGPGLPSSLPRIRSRDLWKLWRRLPDGRPRVWHARRNVEMLGGLVLRSLGAPLKLVFTSASQRQHKGWTRFLIRRMDHVIATSQRTAAYLTVPHSVVMHGIDTAKFSPSADPAAAKAALGLDPAQHYAGCFGRVRHQKGTDVFVDAMIALLPAHPGWSAIIAGRATAQHEGFERDLKQRVADAGLADRILFAGEHTDIERWYRVLSLFVAPQRWEGFGLTPLEAMATGVPVVATDVGAFPELVEEGVTGAIIPRGDVQAMVDAARGYMADDAVRGVTGQAALGHAQANFPLEREARQLIEIYARLTQQSRSV